MVNHGIDVVERLGVEAEIGVGEGQYYLASDVTAFLKHTRKALFLEDGDMTPERMGELLGPRRLPMLVVDQKDLLRDRTAFSALFLAKSGERSALVYRGASANFSERVVPWAKLKSRF